MKYLGLSEDKIVKDILVDYPLVITYSSIIEVADTDEVYEKSVKANAPGAYEIMDKELFEQQRTFKWDEQRLLRNQLLTECDWVVLPHSPVAEASLQAWLDYRQELRDCIKPGTNPFAIVWPQKP